MKSVKSLRFLSPSSNSQMILTDAATFSPLNAVLLAALVFGLFALGYRYYSRFLSRKIFQIADTRRGADTCDIDG